MFAWSALTLSAVLCVTPLTAPSAPHCVGLARQYAPRYQLAVNKEADFRTVKKKGQPTQLVVLGEGSGSAVDAAAALLLAALRYGLGYDAVLRLQSLDVCPADRSILLVAPATYIRHCSVEDYHWVLDHQVAASGSPRVSPLGPLLARAPSNCSGLTDARALASCASSLTFGKFVKLATDLPHCKYTASQCINKSGSPLPPHPAAHVVLTVASSNATLYQIEKLNEYVCDNATVPFTFLRFDNSTCFRRTLQRLLHFTSDDESELSFLFFDEKLEMYSTVPGLISAELPALGGGEPDDRCSRQQHTANSVVRIGDGNLMNKYAPQVADVVDGFCPSLKHLTEVLYYYDRTSGAFGIEEAACEWASRNGDEFQSWIKSKRYTYRLYCYVCSDDRLEEGYSEMIETVQRAVATHDDFEIKVHLIKHIDCHSDQSMEDHFEGLIKQSVVGVVALSSSGSVASLARNAAREHVPLVLAGPAAPAASATAIDGTLQDLVYFYRAFLTNCQWTRFAILSDGSAYSKAFTDLLIDGHDFIPIEKKMTPDIATEVLESLRGDGARVFVVNMNSSMTVEIIKSAVLLGMTPPQYAWIVREWSPPASAAAASWGDMGLFSLSTAWRGAKDAMGVAGSAAGGQPELRAQLDALWPGAAWPALAAPLVDAMVLLNYTFSEFHKLYSRSSYEMKDGEYALNFSQIYEKIKVPGVARELTFKNGTVESVTVYLEKWQSGSRTVLGAWERRALPAWDLALCGARTADRPACSFPAGGRAFVQRCYDVPLYSLFVVLALLPLAFLAARRARLQRLAVRDLNLLAKILDGERIAPVVSGDTLRVHEKIGMGIFGSVYLASLRQSKEKSILVAAKELRDESDKREYLHEAGTLQLVDHENIVKFVGICLSNGSLLILMEYALHGDLLQYLRARRDLPATDREAAHVSACGLTRLAREAAAALHYLAGRGIVHRDVRAANCLVDEHRTLKLADFGLARRLSDELEYTSLRRAFLPVLWMAPESLVGGTFSAASDVWSLGVLLLELVTLGARPYGACPPQLVLALVKRGGHHPPLPPDASPQTVSLVMACWRQEAAQRATAGDVQRYLAREPHALRPARLPAPAPDLLSPPAAPLHDHSRRHTVGSA